MLRSLSKTVLCLAAAALIATAPALAQDTAVVLDDCVYRINGVDLLHISVYGEQNLDKDVPVQPDVALLPIDRRVEGGDPVAARARRRRDVGLRVDPE